ncbi:MAG: exopolysaccharide biosynthesis protein [Ketobacter sp.]|nr:MAG: exopolysaccharide biosynthesis protein [Ketobacter sp.]
MSRIKSIVEHGKQELGIGNQATEPANVGDDRSGKLYPQYTNTRTVEVTPETLLANRIIAQGNVDPRAKRFQVLRTKILQQMRKKNWNTLAITAPTEGAGKSLVAANLAVSMAMEGNQTVLLVDMDLSKPSIHRYFGFQPEHGIHDYFDGSSGIEEILVHPGIERLVLLPGKRGIVNSSEQISSPMVKHLVQELKARYESRLVIFDLPPTLVSDEVLVFLPYVDCSLLVVEAGKNTPKEVENALEAVGTNPLLGTVLNKSDQAKDLPIYN